MAAVPTPASSAASSRGPRPDFAFGEATLLLREILRLTKSMELDMGAALGTNPTDFAAMQHLMESGPLSPGELARRLGVTTAAVTGVIDRLEGLSHARREPDPDDRRRLLVVPEPASVRRALDRLLPLTRGAQAVLDDLDEGERAVVTRYLEGIAAVYREQLERAEQD